MQCSVCSVLIKTKNPNSQTGPETNKQVYDSEFSQIQLQACE